LRGDELNIDNVRPGWCKNNGHNVGGCLTVRDSRYKQADEYSTRQPAGDCRQSIDARCLTFLFDVSMSAYTRRQANMYGWANYRAPTPCLVQTNLSEAVLMHHVSVKWWIGALPRTLSRWYWNFQYFEGFNLNQ